MKRHISLVYIAAILLSFHYFLVTYINSSFLKTFFSEDVVSILYAAGSLITIILFLLINPLLRKLGNTKLMLLIGAFELLSLIGMAFLKVPFLIAILFMVQQASFPLLLLNLDIFLEHWSDRKEIGSLRGLYLMVLNTCAPLSALASGYLVSGNNFTVPYALSGAFMLSLLLLVGIFFKHYKDTAYESVKVKVLAHDLSLNKNLRSIFMSNLLLQFVYSWLIIYIPLYLTIHLGMSWEKASGVIAISLISFIIFQIPLGKIADAWNAEKPILLIGFLLLIFGFGAMPFAILPSFIIWAIILFVTRTGASLVEVASESYFFKQITDRNSQVMEWWRINMPLASIFGAVVGTIAHLYIPFRYTFFIMSAILLLGIYFARSLTKALPLSS